MAANTDSVNNDLSSMVKLFECPVCFDHVTPPIHQCTNGHLVCNKCLDRRPRMDNCPVCRTSIFSRIKVRNLQMEAVAVTIGQQFECGTCDQKCRLNELSAHRFECDPITHWYEDKEMRAGVAERIGRLLDRKGFRLLTPISDFEQFVFDWSRSREQYDHRARQMFRAIENLSLDRLLRLLNQK